MSVGDPSPLPVCLVLLEPLFLSLKLESRGLGVWPTMFLPPGCPGSGVTLLGGVSEVWARLDSTSSVRPTYWAVGAVSAKDQRCFQEVAFFGSAAALLCVLMYFEGHCKKNCNKGTWQCWQVTVIILENATVVPISIYLARFPISSRLVISITSTAMGWLLITRF